MRIACLGAARITPNSLIYPAKVVGNITLQAVAARDIARARSFAEKYDIHEALDSYDALVQADNIDVVYNALPNHLHAKWTIQALKAGKHVICEKPLAMNFEEAKAVVDTSKATGMRVIEAFHCRYHPAYEQLIAWLQAGKIGSIKSVNGHFNVTIQANNGRQIRHHPETGGGAMMDLGCYPLHWVLSAMEQAADSIEASATLNALGVDESLSAHMTFSEGQTAHISTSMAQGQPFSAFLQIEGERGTITFDNPLAPHKGAALRCSTKSGTEHAAISSISTYAYQLQAIVKALDSGEPLPTENDAILLQQSMLDRVYQAADLGYLRETSQPAQN